MCAYIAPQDPYLNKYNERKGDGSRVFRPNGIHDKRIRVNCSVKCHVVAAHDATPFAVECFKPLNG